MASKVDKKTGIKIASDAKVMQIQDVGKKKTERAKLQRTQEPLHLLAPQTALSNITDGHLVYILLSF